MQTGHYQEQPHPSLFFFFFFFFFFSLLSPLWKWSSLSTSASASNRKDLHPHTHTHSGDLNQRSGGGGGVRAAVCDLWFQVQTQILVISAGELFPGCIWFNRPLPPESASVQLWSLDTRPVGLDRVSSAQRLPFNHTEAMHRHFLSEGHQCGRSTGEGFISGSNVEHRNNNNNNNNNVCLAAIHLIDLH